MKRVNMKNLLFILTSFCGIVWSKELSLPTLPLSDYIDTEVSTNIVVDSALQNFRELNVGVFTNQGLANLVEVSFGKDISLDGVLSSKEAVLVFKFTESCVMCSYEDRNIFLEECQSHLTNAIINATFLTNGNMQDCNLVVNGNEKIQIAMPPLTKEIMSQWDLMRVVRRGANISNEQVNIRIATDMTILLLK